MNTVSCLTFGSAVYVGMVLHVMYCNTTKSGVSLTYMAKKEGGTTSSPCMEAVHISHNQFPTAYSCCVDSVCMLIIEEAKQS